jgi:NADH:ubiquinone oxidoreductase subunit 6 (subunit J)
LFGAGVLLAGRFAWTTGGNDGLQPVSGTVENIGTELFRRWVLPFEITALLLIIAAAGAIALAFFRDDDEVEGDA